MMAVMVRSGACVLLLLAVASAAQQDQLVLKSQQAKELMAAGRFAEAVPLYAQLVRAVPNNPGLLLNLGMAQRMAGQVRESIPQFEAAVRLDPKLFPAWASMGAAWLDLGQPAKAAAPFDKAAELQPADPDLRFMAAQASMAAERFETAARHFRKLGELAPGNPKPWYGLGRAYEALAQRTFEQLGKTGENSAPWLALLADTRLSQRQYAAAFSLYRGALAKSPRLRGAHAAIAEIYRNTGHADWAAAEEKKEPAPPACARPTQECAFRAGRFLEAARVAGPPGPDGLYWQSRAYNELARQVFGKLGALPPSPEGRRVQAEIELGRGRYVEAANAFRDALKLAPEDRELKTELASALFRGRDLEGARAVLEPLLYESPEDPPLNFMYGDALLKMEQPEKALPYLEKAVKGDGTMTQAQASLGLACARTGQSEKAIPHLRAALDIDTDGSLHYQLSRAYQATGQAQAAAEMLKKYQQMQERQTEGEESAITPP